VLAAGGFDGGTRLRHVVHHEAEVVHADEVAATLAGVLLGLVAQESDVHHAVAQVHALRAGPVGLADALEAEGFHVERRRLLRVGHGNGDVPELGHGASA
jgi:hypothetical protein